jgi:recombination protein RecA
MKKKKIGTEIEQLINEIRRDFNDPSLLQIASDKPLVIDVVSSGSLSLDKALGVGGFPRGRITELYGKESSGKTTLALSAVRNTQNCGGIAAYIDAESSFDVLYAKTIGVDIDSLILSQPDYGEQALDIADRLVKSGKIDLIVIDSVAALVPKAELEGTMEDKFMGGQARMMGQALRKLAAVVNKSNTSLIFINQLREKIGIMFGNPETTPGGRALKFYAAVRLDLRRTGDITVKDEKIGINICAKIVKNKVAPPFKVAEFSIRYSQGIDTLGELIDLAIKYNIIKKSGAWMEYKENKVQGLEQLYEYILHSDTAKILEKEVKEALKNG